MGPTGRVRTVRFAEADVTVPWRVIALALGRSLGAVAITLVLYSLAPVPTKESAAVAIVVSLAGLLALATVFSWQVSRISRSARPAIAALEAFIFVFGMFLTLFATLYLGLSSSDPDAFSQGMDKVGAVYFSVTVLATVGFGDISAVSDAARIAVTIQMILDLVLIGAAVKLLGSSARRAIAANVQASSAQASPSQAWPDADQEGIIRDE